VLLRDNHDDAVLRQALACEAHQPHGDIVGQ
jgi:hypothetical protein